MKRTKEEPVEIAAPEKPKSKEVFLYIPHELWLKIKSEMDAKELLKPQPVILAALRRQYESPVEMKA